MKYEIHWVLQRTAGLMPKESRDGLPTFLSAGGPTYRRLSTYHWPYKQAKQQPRMSDKTLAYLGIL